MLPLVLAAAVATTPLAPKAADCPAPQIKIVGPPHAGARKLGELPDAMAIRAVLRSVDGCQYQDVIRFHVSEGGPVYPSGTLAPIGGAIEPVTPTAEGR